MNEQEKYWGRTSVLTAHMEAMLKASREYAKMMSNNGETPAQRASRARDFQCGAIWEEGYSNSSWHPASETPVFDEFDDNKEVIGIWMHQNLSAFFVTIPYNVVDYVQYENGKWLHDGSSVPVKYWCYPPKEE